MSEKSLQEMARMNNRITKKLYAEIKEKDEMLKAQADYIFILERALADKTEEVKIRKKDADYWMVQTRIARKNIKSARIEALNEFKKKSEDRLIHHYKKYHRDDADMFYQGSAEAIWECIGIHRNLIKEMTEV